MANGVRGRGVQEALLAQVRVGEFFGAKRFVAIEHAHATVDYEVMGDAGVAYLARLVAAGARVAVPTTRNARSVCPILAGRLQQDAALIENEDRVSKVLEALGVQPINSCTPYATSFAPSRGSHVAWGDTGAAAYANGVLGARTNFEGGIAGVWAALTGRTPEFGFHLTEARLATATVRVDADLANSTDWAVLGAVIGERVRGYESVPAVVARDLPDGSEFLKGFAAALASYGSIAMFHIVGATPEAETLDQATGGRSLGEAMLVTRADIDAYYNRAEATQPVELVVFTAPQLSDVELAELDELVAGRAFDRRVTVIITSSAASLERLAAGPARRLHDAGALLVDGTCWYLMEPARMRTSFGWHRVLTNSPKLANIIPSSGYLPTVRPTAECVEAAVTGWLP